MRGLDEIRKINENPWAFHGEEIHGASHNEHPNNVESKSESQTDFTDFNDMVGGIIAEIVVLDTLATLQDRIQPGIDHGPFLAFWQELNAQREREGRDEVLYKEAKMLFEGGPTPHGALTFIGKEWEGIRAVPYAGKYHGQYREVTERGTVWHTCKKPSGPVEFTSVEDALNDAREVRDYRVVRHGLKFS
jgi:hypothetical protein